MDRREPKGAGAPRTQAVSAFDLDAREFGNADEAITMVKKAAGYARINGKKSLAGDVNQFAQRRFIDRDLYLNIYSTKAECIMHKANARVVDIDTSRLKDAGGKFFFKGIIAMGKAREKAEQATSGLILQQGNTLEVCLFREGRQPDCLCGRYKK
jgi:hypothetical protein